MTPFVPFPDNCLSRQKGGAIIEFALILTLLITLMAGIFEFGRAFWYYESLTKATRNGARMMSMASKSTIASVGVSSTKSLVANAVIDAGVPSFSTTNVNVFCLDVSLSEKPCTDGSAPDNIRVEITGYTVTIGRFIPFLLGGSNQYTATFSPHTTMRYML